MDVFIGRGEDSTAQRGGEWVRVKTGGEHLTSSQGVLGGARGLKKQRKILPPRVFQRAGLGVELFLSPGSDAAKSTC